MGAVNVCVCPPSVTRVATMKRSEWELKVRVELTERACAPVALTRAGSCIMCTASSGDSARASSGVAGLRNSLGVESRSLG